MFLTDLYYQFIIIRQDMRSTKPYLHHPLHQVWWDKCDNHSHQPLNNTVREHYIFIVIREARQ